MIPPIHSNISIENEQEIHLIPKVNTSYTHFNSILQSQEKYGKNFFEKIGNCIQSFFQKISHFFIYLFSIFCCCFTKHPMSNIEKARTGNFSRSLDAKDPFQNHIFEVKNGVFQVDAKGHYIFKNRIHFEKVFHLFSILGTGGPLYWLKHQSTLFQLKKEILSFKFLPFEFLFYVFMNKEMSTYVANFKDNACGVTLNMILAALKQKHPWDDDFIQHQARDFREQYQQNPDLVTKFIPGFCKLLELKENTIRSFVLNNKWEELISYIFEERTKFL